jgi:hypothetical protein
LAKPPVLAVRPIAIPSWLLEILDAPIAIDPAVPLAVEAFPIAIAAVVPVAAAPGPILILAAVVEELTNVPFPLILIPPAKDIPPAVLDMFNPATLEEGTTTTSVALPSIS